MNKELKKDWNQLNIQLLQQKDSKELEKLYCLIKPYFMHLFHSNEDLFNDLFITIHQNIDKAVFDGTKGKFHNWICTLGHNQLCYHYKQTKKDKVVYNMVYDLSYINEFSNENFIDRTNKRIEYETFSVSQKEILEEKIKLLKPEEQLFINDYLNKSIERNIANRVKYSRLVKKLKIIELPYKEDFDTN